MQAQIKPKAYYAPRTSLVMIENTHNRAGGRVFPQNEIVAIAAGARAHGLALHLDGARVWNASVACGLPVRELCAPFDTVTVCFSKGLGAPAGSAFCGARETVERARRFRKMWGGGMRQVGILAAAARHALAHHRERIAEDHAHAKLFAESIARAPGVRVDASKVETNIVNVDLDPPLAAEDVAAAARALGLAINPSGPRRLRAVTHLDVGRADLVRAAEVLAEAVGRVRAERA